VRGAGFVRPPPEPEPPTPGYVRNTTLVLLVVLVITFSVERLLDTYRTRGPDESTPPDCFVAGQRIFRSVGDTGLEPVTSSV
jgi:hypothetical protein